MPLDESLAYYWASIGFSAAGVVLFLWLLKPARKVDSREPTVDSSESASRKDGKN